MHKRYFKTTHYTYIILLRLRDFIDNQDNNLKQHATDYIKNNVPSICHYILNLHQTLLLNKKFKQNY